MKFLCVPCDSPMKLQSVGPPEGGSLSVVYACPECGYEMAMLTNTSDTGRPVSGRANRPRGGAVGEKAGSRRRPLPVHRRCPGATRRSRRQANPFLSAGPPPPKRGSRTSPRSFAPWRGQESKISPGNGERWKLTNRSSTRPATLRHVRHRDEPAAFGREPALSRVERVRPPLCRLLEPHLPLQPRLRALLSRRRRHASAHARELRRSERLGTEGCFRVIDGIAAFAPECLTILTGGRPLLRRDILEIVRRAAERGLWVVVGTNGVRITENLARRLAEAGARGLSLSLDALDPDRHDRFRMVRGAWRNTVEGAEILHGTGSPSSCRRPRARTISASSTRSPTSRAIAWPPRSGTSLPGADGARAVRLRHDPRAVRRGARLSLPDPAEVQPPDARQREVRSALHQDRSRECPGQPVSFLPIRQSGPTRRGRRVSGGDALHGDPAERRRHPVPLPPGFRREPSQRGSRGPLDLLGAVRRHPPPILARGAVRGVRDERPLRGLPHPGLRDDRRPDGGRSALHPHPREVRGGSPVFSTLQGPATLRGSQGCTRCDHGPDRQRQSPGTMRPRRD